MGPLVGHLEIQYSIAVQGDKLSDRGSNRSYGVHRGDNEPRAGGGGSLRGNIREKDDTCAEPKDVKELFGQRAFQAGGTDPKSLHGTICRELRVILMAGEYGMKRK